MTDRTIGKGPATFLAHLAERVPIETIRKNWKAGEYPDLTADYAKANVAFRGVGCHGGAGE